MLAPNRRIFHVRIFLYSLCCLMSSRTVIPSVFNLSHILPLFYIYDRQASWFYLPVSISFFPVFSNGLCEQNSKTLPSVKIGTLEATKTGDSIDVNIGNYSKFLFVIDTPDSYTGDTFIVPKGISAGFSSELRAVPNDSDSKFYGYVNMRWLHTGKLSVERLALGASWSYINVTIYGIN